MRDEHEKRIASKTRGMRMQRYFCDGDGARQVCPCAQSSKDWDVDDDLGSRPLVHGSDGCQESQRSLWPLRYSSRHRASHACVPVDWIAWIFGL